MQKSIKYLEFTKKQRIFALRFQENQELEENQG